MRVTPLLPVAPRPYEDEVLSSWQARVSCRYGCTALEIERWLGNESEPMASQSFSRDLAADPAILRLWALGTRLKVADIEHLLLARAGRPADWYVEDPDGRGFCPDCLDEDQSVGRDHHFRREWAFFETAVCQEHRRMLQDRCGRCFSQGLFRFDCLGDRARLVCGSCSAPMAEMTGHFRRTGDVDFLLVLSQAVKTIVTRGEGASLDKLTDAVERLWRPSQRDGKPFIAWFNLPMPPGYRSLAARPRTALSLEWRVITLLAAGQLLDLAEARRGFGPPPAFMLRDNTTTLPRSLPIRPVEEAPTRSAGITPKLRLRSDAEYLRLAEQIIASTAWREIAGAAGRSREKQLGRLLYQALKTERGQSDGPRPTAP